jgi:hypothetical protein
MHLVDLAGSERVASQKHRGILKDAGYINKSLSCLGDVITLRRILTREWCFGTWEHMLPLF